MKYSGADWIKKSFNVEMSELGEKVADILGQVFCGIYHLDSEQLKKVNWDDDYYITFKYDGTLSNFDFNLLTKLLVLCFDNKIRINISAYSRQHIELMFHNIKKEIPTLEKMVEDIRKSLKLEEK